MKIITILVFSLYSAITSAALTEKEATKYLVSADCQLGVFIVSDQGRVNYTAQCFESREEPGAKKHKFCVMSSIDMGEGTYMDMPPRNDPRRFEGEYCTQKTITEILQRPFVVNLLSNIFGNNNSADPKLPQWHITQDKKGAGPYFMDKFQFKAKK